MAGTPCVHPVETVKWVGNHWVPIVLTQVPQACANAGLPAASAMTEHELNGCLECIYGMGNVYGCSDSFALRPAAFSMRIDDQNQSNIAMRQVIEDNNHSTAPLMNLAAGYDYYIEVNATNHIENSPADDYNTTLAYEVSWNNNPSLSCNDTGPHSVSLTFADGNASLNNFHVNQVGSYTLRIVDSAWADVDEAVGDCIVGSSATSPANSGILNGCDISTNHSFSGAVDFTDFNTTLHPYKFTLGIVPSAGLAHNTAATHVYMANMVSQDENMSFHLDGNISARGYNDANLSNFVANCYAKPLVLDINKTDTNLSNQAGFNVPYKGRFHNLDENNTIVVAHDINVTYTDTNSSLPIQLQTGQAYFTQDLNGTMSTRLNLNYNREVNASANPKQVTFGVYKADCNTTTDCTFNADLTTKTTHGENTLNRDITYLYGRTHTSKQRYNCPTDDADGIACNNKPANIYFESFCFGAGCDKNLLPNGLTSKNTDDLRWFWSETHNIANDGNVSIVVQKGGTNGADIVTATDNPVGNPSVTTLNYNGSRGYPYRTTMQNGASPWLIYNENDPTATRNEFQVEFNSQGDWTGEHNTSTTTKSDNAIRTNRRIMW